MFSSPVKNDAFRRELQDTPDLDKYLAPSVKTNNHNSFSKHLQCPICIGLLRRPKRAPCGHSFCSLCIENWLKINKTCPQDRSTLTSNLLHNDFITENLISELPAICPYGTDCYDKNYMTVADARRHAQDKHSSQLERSDLSPYSRQHQSFSFFFVLLAFAMFDLLLRLTHDTNV